MEAPPRTVDVQKFAKARATELLSLHSGLKTRKRKASPQQDGSRLGTSTGDGNDQIVDSGVSNTSTSLPRHLRRRTSSYVRRRRPLPWLYKRKKNPPITFSSSFGWPKKRRKQRQKQRRLSQQNASIDGDVVPTQECSDSRNAHQVAGLASRLGSDSIAIDQRCPPEADAPMSMLTNQTIFQQEPLDVQRQNHIDCDVIASFQEASGAGAISSVIIPGADAFVQLETNRKAALENVEVAGALSHVGSIVSEDKGADFPSQSDAEVSFVEKEVTATTLELISNGVHESGGINFSHNDKNSIVSISEDKIASQAQVPSQAAQQEVVQSERNDLAMTSVDDIAPLVQSKSHEFRPESVVNGESTVCLMVDDVTGLACHTGQEDSIDHISTEEVHAQMCIDGVPSHTQMGTFAVQNIRKKKKNMCRPLRRLLEFKPGGSLISSDGTWRLGTHVWHAKRFTIEKMWGYRIPLGRHGRGHGSRSVLRWSKSKALLHDCSFINAIQLIGSEEKIMQVLRPVLELPQGMGSYFEAGEGSFPGGYFTTAILHHVIQAFHGIISPAIMMWKPVMPEVSTAEKIEGSQERNLWLWVHASAFEEAYQVLEDICLQVNKHMKEEGVVCVSRKGDLGRLDLIGEGSFAVLQKVLFPTYRDQQGKCEKLEQLAEVLNPKQINGKAVVHLEVSDPRLKENERCLALDPVCIFPVAVFDDRGSKSKDFVVEGRKSAEAELEHKHETLNTIPGEEAHNYLNNKTIDALWEYKQKFGQPVREKFLSRMRHTDRLDTFGLTQTTKSNRMLERRKNLSQRFTCPVILLKHEHEEASACGWSLILPLSWISAFWVPLVFAGGHVIGIRERHWLCTNAGSPAFPDDFPDCKAYVNTKADKSLQGAQFFCKRHNKIGPPMPDQTCVCVQEVAVEGLVQSPLMFHAADQGKTQNVAGLEYGCFVARTLEQLFSYLQMTHQTGLLLFPAQKKAPTKFKGLGSRLHEGTVVWRPKTQNLQASRTTHCVQAVCLLRVCLRPFGKGVVKVGTKVYAPTSEDYLVWSCKENASGTSVLGVHRSEKAIGYATSMAPRGSKVSAAIAFCDAVALGLARQRQWVDTTWHKKNEVFLMFCNEGSTTFRPAFASICIEAGPDI